MGAAVGLLVSVLYLLTLAPSVLYYAQVTQDSPALQATVPNLGISHPTGYPTYMMLAHLFTYLPVGDVAYRVNLSSAAFGVLAVLLAYLVGLKLSGRALAAAVGAVAFGVCQGFWSQAVIAEVYTLNAAFIALVFLVLLVWRERRQDRYLLICAFLGGLSLTNHLTSGLLIPAGLVFVSLVDRRKLAEAGLWLRGTALFILGLLPYAYLPVRAEARLPENTADTSTVSGFMTVVSGGPFKEWMFAFGPIELAGRFTMYLGYLAEQFPLPLLLVGVFGAVYMLVRDLAGAALLGIVFVGSLVYALEYDISDVYVFFVPTYLILGLWTSMGLGVASEAMGDRLADLFPTAREEAVTGLAVLALAIALLGAMGTYGAVDRSQDYRGRDMGRAVAREVEPGATVVHRRSPLLYMMKVENRREDLDLWDFREPHTGEELAEASEALAQGSLYLLSPDSEMVGRFEDGGYRLASIEGEILYQVIPPQGWDDAIRSGVLGLLTSRRIRARKGCRRRLLLGGTVYGSY